MWDDETMQVIKKLVSELVEVRAQLHALQEQTQADVQTYNNVILGLQSGELPWERVQILETGQLRILEETPAVD
jgi:menaquinone-dependent protoporphyrinogen IX oxidase